MGYILAGSKLKLCCFLSIIPVNILIAIPREGNPAIFVGYRFGGKAI